MTFLPLVKHSNAILYIFLSDPDAAENVLADFVLALLPISIIWNLNMSLKKRVNLCILLSLSLW